MNEIENILTNFPQCRERKNKNLFIARMLQKKYSELDSTALSRIADMVVEAGTLDRGWRKALQDNESLRGNDYEEGKILAQGKVLSLGYEVGYKQLTA